MSQTFRIGVSHDFYSEAREHTEAVLREKFASRPDIECVPMPPHPDKFATAEVLDQFDAIFALATKITTESLQGVERLVLVARWGVGYDRIDTDALTAADVALSITPNAVKRPVAEAILTFILALSKNILVQDRVTRAGGWRGNLPRLGVNIAGTTLASVGCGNIAREMFRLCGGLGFGRFIAADPYVTTEQAAEVGVELVDLDTLFQQGDYVAVNTLLNASTRSLVQERHFRMMKPTAFFINTARGPIVDHAALVKALREKWIAGAGIDVFPVEPPPKDDPLFELDNAIVAPHALAWTNELMRNNGFEASDNVLAVASGNYPGGVVNRAVFDSPRFQAKLRRYR
jgi:phosphoglycerate dehydrogenase-like enzyme